MATNLDPATTFPRNPDPEEYDHLSEWDKMIKGYPYQPTHKDLLPQRIKCRDLIQKYNNTAFDDEKTRREILDELFDPSCKANKTMFIEPSFRADYGINITVGDNFYANFECVLLDTGTIKIGKNCMLAPGVHIYTGTHSLNAGYRKLSDMPNCFERTAPVKIGDNCWLGGGCVINPGVTLGNNVVVGAGSMVTKSFPDNVVVAGNPAKVIRHMPEPSLNATEPFWKDMDGVMDTWGYIEC